MSPSYMWSAFNNILYMHACMHVRRVDSEIPMLSACAAVASDGDAYERLMMGPCMYACQHVSRGSQQALPSTVLTPANKRGLAATAHVLSRRRTT